MNDEERAEFEAMRAREAEMEAHFAAAEARVAQSQRDLAEQQQATTRMQQEWEAMKQEVNSTHHTVDAQTWGLDSTRITLEQTAATKSRAGESHREFDCLIADTDFSSSLLKHQPIRRNRPWAVHLQHPTNQYQELAGACLLLAGSWKPLQAYSHMARPYATL